MGKTWIFFFEYIVLYIICKEWFTFAWNGNILLKIYVSTTVNETVLAIGCCLGNQNTMRQPCWMFDVFCTDKFWVLYIYLYTNWSQYIYIICYIIMYIYIHIQTTQTHRDKEENWGCGRGVKQNTEDTSGHGPDLQIYLVFLSWMTWKLLFWWKTKVYPMKADPTENTDGI